MIDPRQLIRTTGGTRVLFVMAADAEYGRCLRERIKPLICGVGPVESAIATSAALCRLSTLGLLPHVVLSLGSAGSRSLQHAGIYQVATVAYRDMDASLLGFEKGTTPFAGHAAVIAVAPQISGIPSASLATGGSIVSGAGYDGVTADMVDMETFAVLRAAAYFGVPMVGLRGISDGRSEIARFEDWTEYLSEIDARLAAAVDLFDAQILGGTLEF